MAGFRREEQNFPVEGRTDVVAPQRTAPEVYAFSPEEQRVLRQCNIDSFYQRCLPIGTFLGLGTFYAVKAGYLRGHVKYGASPKTCVAVIAGYFIGKLSYQKKCAEKLMELPNSRLGEMLRQRRRQGLSENISLDQPFSSAIGLDTTVSSTEIAPRRSYLDMDSERPAYVGDFDRPPVQDETFDVSQIPVPPGGVPITTYDELRKKNRDDYDSQRSKPWNRPFGDAPEPAPIGVRPPSEQPKRSGPKNKYGDEWEQ